MPIHHVGGHLYRRWHSLRLRQKLSCHHGTQLEEYVGASVSFEALSTENFSAKVKESSRAIYFSRFLIFRHGGIDDAHDEGRRCHQVAYSRKSLYTPLACKGENTALAASSSKVTGFLLFHRSVYYNIPHARHMHGAEVKHFAR